MRFRSPVVGSRPMSHWRTGALVSGKFRYSTGEVINVDGGFHLRKP